MSQGGAEPIAVVGAGIGGLALAAALQRRGRAVMVFEAGDRLSTAGAGISLWPNALAALDDIGLGSPVRAAGGAAVSGGIRSADGRWLRRMDRARVAAALGEPVIALHRAKLLEVLASAVDPAVVHVAAPVRAIHESPAGATLTLAGGTSVTAAAVVGADGIGSIVAGHLNPGLSRRYAGYTAWRGIAERDPGCAEPAQTWGPDGEFGFLPMGAGQTYWFATQTGAAGQKAPSSELAYLSQRYAGWHQPIGDLLASTNPETVLRHDVYDRQPARRWSAGHVVLIGDAAHPMRPHLGQGGCQALVDAAVLTRLIDQSHTLPTAFSRFASQRRRETKKVINASALIGHAIHSHHWLHPAIHQLTALIPEPLLLPHIATIASRNAFTKP